MQGQVKCESCDKIIPEKDATWWETPVHCCFLCPECVAIQETPGDEYADHFVELWEHEEDMRKVAADLEEPHRTKLLDALGRLSDVIQEVNEATDPTKEAEHARASDV